MKIYQTRFGDPDGNCLAACVATITGLPLEDFPPLKSEAWLFHWNAWLRERGWTMDWWRVGQGEVPAGFSVCSGTSPRGDFHHSVVYLDGKHFHDPHPDQTWILDEDDWLVPRRLGALQTGDLDD